MQRYQFNPQTIPAQKAEGQFRVLVLGGSLPYGWPYDDKLSFPRALEMGLAAAAPTVDWRVINMGAPGWGSTRLRLLAEQLVALDSDLVVVTSGNNEFGEAAYADEVMNFGERRMQWWSTIHRNSHLVTIMAEALVPISQFRSEKTRDDRLKSLGIYSPIRLSRLHNQNLASIVRTFKSAGSRVYLTTVPVNLRNSPPFEIDAPGQPLGLLDERSVEDFRRARAFMDAGNFSSAAPILEELVKRDPRSAQLRFQYARTLDANGRFDEARASYLGALDLDKGPMRASSRLNANATALAEDLDVGLVDFVRVMQDASDAGIPGNDLFLDNCHPNRAGILLLALAVARQMSQSGVFEVEPGWEQIFSDATRRYLAEVELSSEDRLRALAFLHHYFTKWNPQPQSAAVLRQQIRALDPEHRSLR
jgi:tetratricopeptide (TPR) repeat protein